MNKNIKLIEELSNAFGAPGNEDDIVLIIKNRLKDDFDLVEDKMRNLIIYKKDYDKNKPTIVIDGHSDEVGYMIQAIKENGLLSFVPLGGFVPNNINAHKVIVRNNDGESYQGIIATKPPHFMTEEERKKGSEIRDKFIDIGATSKREVLEDFNIDAGCFCVPYSRFHYNEKNKKMFGKAFDNRLGCALVVLVMEALKDVNLDVNIVGAISAQEEVGMRGSKVNESIINPDLAIVFEGSPADDTSANEYMIQGGLDRGCQIRLRDVSMIANPRLVKFSENISKKYNIKYQKTVRTGGSTNAGSYHLGQKATPSIVLGVPTRYIHTNHSIASYEDFKSTFELAVQIIKNINCEDIKGF